MCFIPVRHRRGRGSAARDQERLCVAFVYRVFIKGFLILLPILLTLYLFAWIAARAESALGDGLRALFPSLYFPGLGLAVALVLIFLVGLLVNNYLAAQTVAWIEGALERAPVIKAIYGPIRDVMSLFAEAENKGLKRAVLVEFPGMGASAIGLVTRERFDDLRGARIPDGCMAVFIPYSYAVGGFTILARKENVRELGLAPERALQLALTGWLKSEKTASGPRAEGTFPPGSGPSPSREANGEPPPLAR
jgi:uncharacterized membrane protein